MSASLNISIDDDDTIFSEEGKIPTTIREEATNKLPNQKVSKLYDDEPVDYIKEPEPVTSAEERVQEHKKSKRRHMRGFYFDFKCCCALLCLLLLLIKLVEPLWESYS